MKNDNGADYVPNRVGCKNTIFGCQFLEKHNFRDPAWTPYHRIDQFRYIIDLYERNKTLTNFLEHRREKTNATHLKFIKNKLKKNKNKLKIDTYGDVLRTRNTLKSNPILQRRFQNFLPEKIVENIDRITYVLRKEHDRLSYQKQNLSQKYESKLKEVAYLEDLLVSKPNEKQSQHFHQISLNKKYSESRTRAIKLINTTYRNILNVLTNDAIYFEVVLNELKEDIEEQAGLIKRVIAIGQPNIANVKKISLSYDKLEVSVRHNMHMRLAEIAECREQLAGNGPKLHDIIRRDSDIDVYPHRYDHETASMLNLKHELEKVENPIKILKKITACSDALQIYPRVKKQIRDGKHMEASLRRRTKERDVLVEKFNHAHIMHDRLANRKEKEEDRYEVEIKSIKEQMSQHQLKQMMCEKELIGKNKIFIMLINTLQHFMDILRHVGEKLVPSPYIYPTKDLNLPLLNFIAPEYKNSLPIPFEQDADILINEIKKRITLLMNFYESEKSGEEIASAAKKYHTAVIKDYDKHHENQEKDTTHLPLVSSVTSDPNILNRRQIKALSNKIVEKFKSQNL